MEHPFKVTFTGRIATVLVTIITYAAPASLVVTALGR
jgi:hypothetical protein